MDEKFSVWVGSLSSNVKEETLSDFCGKFGPVKSVVIPKDDLGKSRQFGFVSYYSREIAECAATVMDGCELLGQAIKTKGPSELERTRSEPRKDYRMFTDCLFFINGRNCTWKIGQCPFRHCENTKKTERVCEKWMKKQCEELQCPRRHPRLTKATTMIDTNMIPRCPSHNAFKCFGECGNKECSTHFLEHAAYLEHVEMAMKKLVQPVGTCIKCQAVFFKQEEKIDHRCYKIVHNPPPHGANPPRSAALQHFTSTRVQAEKDVAHPLPVYPNKSPRIPDLVYSIEQVNSTSETNKTEIRSDKKYFSGDTKRFSSAVFPKQIENFTTAQAQIRPAQNCISNDSTCCNSTKLEKSYKELEPVGVFWDFENCSVPKGKSAQAVVQKIRRVFFTEKREVEFMCVCDTSKEKRAVIEELNKAQVTVVHINATSKNAADDKLRQSLRRFAQTYCRPATVILISGDGNFAMDLSDLRHRHNFHVVCLHNVAASSALLGFAHQTHRFDLFTEEIQTYCQSSFKPSFSNDVLVSNLPTTKTATVLKARLTKLSDNCGGKVVAINGNKAIVRFPNTEAAFRARRRLDKEDLFGFILRATLLPLPNPRECGDAEKGKRKQKENAAYEGSPTTSPTAKPLMEASVKEGTNTRSWKENQSPNPGRNFPHAESPRQRSPPNCFPDPPVMMSPPFPGQRFPGYPGHVMYNNMFHPTLLHSMFGIPGGTRSIPNSTISTPPSPLTPLVNGVLRRSPSPEQQHNGVDLLVTNINETVSKNEIKKKLASIFREHCKVYSVVLHAKNGAPLRAFVKVPKLMDAHLVISKVSGKKILDQVVHVSLASEKDKELCYIQDEAVTVLQEAPLNWLPLSTFLTNFEKKYRRRLDARHLDQIQDVVVVNGSPGCQTVSLLEGKIDSELVVVDASFSSDVFKLIHHHDGVIVFVSFPALYWLEFHKEIKVSSSGCLLKDLLCRVSNVTVVGTAAKRCVQWIKKPDDSPRASKDLSHLSSELVSILQKNHEFEMTFDRLEEKYLSCYNEQLDAFSYGFQSLADLLSSLSSIVQVKEDPAGNNVCLKQEHRVRLFKKEMEELLQQQPQHSVLLSNFMASYVKHFGQKFKLSSFGFTRLTDLIKAVSGVVEIEGIGDQRMVILSDKKDEMFYQKRQFDELTRGIEELLNDSASQEIKVDSVEGNYFERYGEQISFSQYGCGTLEELLARLSSSFQIVSRGEETFLRHCRTSHSVDDVKSDLFTLVNGQENKLVYVRNIFKLFEKTFHRKFPYELTLLNEALDSVGKPLEVRGNGNDKIIGIFNDDEKQRDHEFVFVKTAVEILYSCEEYCLPRTQFQRLYQQSVLSNKKINEHDAKALPSCAVVREAGGEVTVELRRSYRIRILVEELKQLLASADRLSLSLDELPMKYEELFQRKYNLASHGLFCLEELKEKLNGFIQVTNADQQRDRLSLSPLSQFELETRNLLDNCGGCMSLSRFAPAYQQMYSKPCIVSDYGYTKLSSLINAVPHVARIIGSGPEKVVIAVERSIPERVCSDMLSVRIISGSTEEISSVCLSEQNYEENLEENKISTVDGLQTEDMKCSEAADETRDLAPYRSKLNVREQQSIDVTSSGTGQLLCRNQGLINDNSRCITEEKQFQANAGKQHLKSLNSPTPCYNSTIYFPAGQEKTKISKNSENFPRKKIERSNVPGNPSTKVRLAANFTFPLKTKK